MPQSSSWIHRSCGKFLKILKILYIYRESGQRRHTRLQFVSNKYILKVRNRNSENNLSGNYGADII